MIKIGILMVRLSFVCKLCEEMMKIISLKEERLYNKTFETKGFEGFVYRVCFFFFIFHIEGIEHFVSMCHCMSD